MTHGPTREDLLAVSTFARNFDVPGFVAGEWVYPVPGKEGVLQIGYWAPSEDVARWQAALYEHHIVQAFDWMEPEWTFQLRRYSRDPDLLDRATLLTVRKVLTTLVRAERFCEGSLAESFERGVPWAAMKRLGMLSAAD